ncbi:MAG: hypothetical protein ACOH1Y_17105 [Propionicimonas sp.]
MLFEHLDPQQSVALLEEVTSTRSLLGYGLKALRSGASFATTRDPILTMLSIGFEKLFKLTLGLAELDLHHEWPHVKFMTGFGHDLTRLHGQAMQVLQERTEGSSPYVRGLVAGVRSDPMVPLLIDVLHIYGDSGRFYYLDRLGNRTQDANPTQAWDQFVRAAITDPTIAALLEAASRELVRDAPWQVFEEALRERLAHTVENVWNMVSMCGQNHVLGRNGDLFGVEVDRRNVGRQ